MADSLADLQQKVLVAELGGESPSSAIDAGAGRLALANTTTLELTAAGNIKALVTNNTGKTMRVLALAGGFTATGFGKFYLNPTVGLPTTLRRTNNAILTAPSPGGEMRSDIDAVTALDVGTGTNLELDAFFPINSREVIPLPPIFLPSGNTLGFNINFGGAAKGSLTAFWVVK